MLQAVEAIIHPDETIWLLERKITDTLALLKSPCYKLRPIGNPADMERTIQENRDAWGDE